MLSYFIGVLFQVQDNQVQDKNVVNQAKKIVEGIASSNKSFNEIMIFYSK